MTTQQHGSTDEARHDDLDPRASQSGEEQVALTDASAHAHETRVEAEVVGVQSADETHVETTAVGVESAHELRVDAIDVPESLGQRMRAAREVRGITREEAATRTKMRVSILDALERDEFDRIGHGVYLRGYLTKYLAFLDLPAVLADRVLERHTELPPLMTSGTVSRPRYLFQRYSGSALYLVLTGVIIVPAVLLAMRAGFDSNLVRITPLDTTESAQNGAHADASVIASPTSAPTNSSVAAQNARTDAEERPLAASMTPFAPTAAPTAAVPALKPGDDAAIPNGQHSLKITFAEPSWVDVTSADGRKLEQGIVPAGSTRVYHSEQTLDAHLGNVNGATVEVDGKVQDLSSFRHSNVARFKLVAGESTLSHSGG